MLAQTFHNFLAVASPKEAAAEFFPHIAKVFQTENGSLAIFQDRTMSFASADGYRACTDCDHAECATAFLIEIVMPRAPQIIEALLNDLIQENPHGK